MRRDINILPCMYVKPNNRYTRKEKCNMKEEYCHKLLNDFDEIKDYL